ncbi:hypothetical protein TBR22_A03520 [Luteitalea sp. TBR-22]|nr:hypothetical protein TBR22_A03520 [Luteitalea sp. TBR-22]
MDDGKPTATGNSFGVVQKGKPHLYGPRRAPEDRPERHVQRRLEGMEPKGAPIGWPAAQPLATRYTERSY